jgi:adenosylcobyric acid synthase
VEGYEIHHGVAEVGGVEPFLDGCRVGSVWGTHWHGSLESDAFRRAFLGEVARAAGRRFTAAPDTSFEALREEQLDRLGDLIEEHADTDALWRLISEGAPAGLPFVPPGAPRGASRNRGSAPDPGPQTPDRLEMVPQNAERTPGVVGDVVHVTEEAL